MTNRTGYLFLWYSTCDVPNALLPRQATTATGAALETLVYAWLVVFLDTQGAGYRKLTPQASQMMFGPKSAYLMALNHLRSTKSKHFTLKIKFFPCLGFSKCWSNTVLRKVVNSKKLSPGCFCNQNILNISKIEAGWNNPDHGLRGTLMWDSYVGLLHGTLPWDSYVGLLRGTLTWVSWHTMYLPS